MSAHYPPLAISVHGIRTYGKWQKTFSTVISGSPTRMEYYDYGNYGIIKFLIPYFNNRMIDNFYDWYINVVAINDDLVDLSDFQKRPILVAHSFGSWIAGHAMKKYSDIKFEKIIFSGSILPADFDWEILFSRDQVSRVLNECGQQDPWPNWANRFVRGAGTAGKDGFYFFPSLVKNVKLDQFGHSDVHMRGHMKNNWLPFLQEPPSSTMTVHGRNINSDNEFKRILDYTREVIDKEVYGDISHYSEAAITPGQSIKWISANPDIYTILIDRVFKEPAGYINAMPVTETTYDGIKNGKILDKEITDINIIPFESSVNFRIYLMSIAIKKCFRNLGDGFQDISFSKLFSAMLDKLNYHFWENNCRVSHVLASAWTTEGERICRALGMIDVGKDRFGDIIFELDVSAIVNDKSAKVPRLLRSLVQLYRTQAR